MRLPTPKKEAILYEDPKLYVALASFPIARGHVVVVWKERAPDLSFLNKKEFEHLMNWVDKSRNAMLKVLHLKKVYLFYMDELNQVHWHLVPRYNEKGFNVLMHEPGRLKDFSLAAKIKKYFRKI